MAEIFIGRQKVVMKSKGVAGYELLFRDDKDGIKNFPTNLQATSDVLLKALNYVDFSTLISDGGFVLLNVDHEILLSGLLALLDKDMFILEILDSTIIDEKVISRIEFLKSKGYRFALGNFTCSKIMFNKFKPIIPYLHIIKINVPLTPLDNLRQLMPLFQKRGIKLLAEKIEKKEEFDEYMAMNFDFFQGYFIHKPETLTYKTLAQTSRAIVINLITAIKQDKDLKEIAKFLKTRPDLTYKLLKFLNNNSQIKEPVKSITNALALMGQKNLLRWLLIFLYSGADGREIPQKMLDFALDRAELMEGEAKPDAKESAFMTGMFSCLELIYDKTNSELFKDLKVDPIIKLALMERKGELGALLTKAEDDDRTHLKAIFLKDFQKYGVKEIVKFLQDNGSY